MFLLSKIIYVIANRTNSARFLPSDFYLKIAYETLIGKKLNLECPQTFNEKLQWLKLHNQRIEYTAMVDKYAVKQYVANKIGKQYIIPTLGVWKHFDEIDFDKLPNQFVLKCTHDSGGLVICEDKYKLDKKAAKEKIEKCLKRNYYWVAREWPYKNVQPQIIAEKYLTDTTQNELIDYKIMMFDGKEYCSFVCTNRYSENGLNVTFYDKNWEIMKFERHYPRSTIPIEKPKSYQTMIELARKLSAGIPFVRIDFYEVKGQVYFGEITFFPGSGFEEFSPDYFDKTLGELIKLPSLEN